MRLLALALSLSLTCSALHARTLYISEHGSDGSDGRAPDRAWRTLERAGAALRGGDTLKVMPGGYDVAPWQLSDLGSVWTGPSGSSPSRAAVPP